MSRNGFGSVEGGALLFDITNFHMAMLKITRTYNSCNINLKCEFVVSIVWLSPAWPTWVIINFYGDISFIIKEAL